MMRALALVALLPLAFMLAACGESKQSLYDRGFRFQEKGDYSNAVVLYTRALEIDPNYSWALFNRGMAYYRMGSKIEAYADLKRASDLKLDNATKALGLLFRQ